MSVVGKWTCSDSKTGLYKSYHSCNAVRYIKQRSYFLKDGLIPGYFGTKYMTVLQIEQILHNFEDQKIANFFNLEHVNFSMTLVIRKMMSASSLLGPRCVMQYPGYVVGVLSNIRYKSCPYLSQYCFTT